MTKSCFGPESAEELWKFTHCSLHLHLFCRKLALAGKPCFPHEIHRCFLGRPCRCIMNPYSLGMKTPAETKQSFSKRLAGLGNSIPVYPAWKCICHSRHVLGQESRTGWLHRTGLWHTCAQAHLLPWHVSFSQGVRVKVPNELPGRRRKRTACKMQKGDTLPCDRQCQVNLVCFTTWLCIWRHRRPFIWWTNTFTWYLFPCCLSGKEAVHMEERHVPLQNHCHSRSLSLLRSLASHNL